MIKLKVAGLGKHFASHWVFRDLNFEVGGVHSSANILGYEGVFSSINAHLADGVDSNVVSSSDGFNTISELFLSPDEAAKFASDEMNANGVVFGIAGRNGSGKSTLMRCLAGLNRADAGSVEWFQDGVLLDRQKLRDISGYAALYNQLYGDLTCEENLVLLRTREDQGLLNTNELMSMVDLFDKRDTFYKSLSSGQQQRMKILAAIQSDPTILFLDEPTTNLDARGKGILDGLVEERREMGQITIIASNEQFDLDMCDEILDLGS
jgi:ABC-type transport system involved in cytochrome c biogenesis ATPase subunit